MGGYSSFPICVASIILRIKFIRFERLFELIYLFGFLNTTFMMFEFFGVKFKSFIRFFISHKKFNA